MTPITLPSRYNYIAAFLTLDCGLGCSYCITRFGGAANGAGQMSGEDWARGLNRLVVAGGGLPLTLQGGEPGLHPDFLSIINGVRPELDVDILTNLGFDVERFMAHVGPERMRRGAPYASIRASYHPETMELRPLVDKVLRLMEGGYSVGIWGVLHPEYESDVLKARAYCASVGIDFRTKEFLGWHNGRLYGTYKYPGACNGWQGAEVLCRTSEMVIGPAGGIYRCHSDLYAGRKPVGHLLDEAFEVDERFLPCAEFGSCNPCDVKVKTDRFQRYGHTSVEVRRP